MDESSTNSLSVRVLVLHRTEEGAEAVRAALGAGRPIVQCTAVESVSALEACLDGGSWDAVICALPPARAAGALRSRGLDLPLLVVGGNVGEDAVAEAFRTGAHDFIGLDHLDRLLPALERELARARTRRRQARVSAARRQNEARFRALFETMALGIVYKNAHGEIQSANPAAERILGLTREEMRGRDAEDPCWRAIRPDGSDFPPDEFPSAVALRTGRTVKDVPIGLFNAVERRHRWLEISAMPHFSKGATRPHIVYVTLLDVTERVAAEEESRRRVRQHSAVATLGRHALDAPLDELFDLAVTLVRDTLEADWGSICELTPDGSRLALRACTDHHEEIGRAFVDLEGEDFALRLGAAPRGIDDIDGNASLCDDTMRRLGLRSGVTVPIQGRARAFGVIGVHSTRSHCYSQDDIDFLRIMANILATAIEQAEDRRQIGFQADLLDRVGQAVISTDTTGAITYWNRAAETLFGWSEGDVRGHHIIRIVLTTEDAARASDIVRRLKNGDSWRGDMELKRRDGSTFPALVAVTPMVGPQGQILALIGTCSDMSEHRTLEDQLRQAQKMEAVGRLAGGVAHDFNNLLTAIQGHTDFLLDEFAEADPVRADLEQIRKAATRAAALTRQLLAFSRKQVLQPRVVHLQTIVREMEKMLTRIIGEDIQVVTDLLPDALAVRVDPGQLEQVLLNLVVNARDAMPAGGRLGVAVRTVDMAAGDRAASLALQPGRYSVLEVSDTGCGMSADIRARIFEPFFTTKDAGRGTGLGLSTVYGIVQQSGGAIDAQSEPGRGSTFCIFLPVVDATPAVASASTIAEPLVGSETILFAEDDDSVRSLACRILRKHGYTVLAANGGGEALLLCERHAGRIDLLLTDVVMPQMSGRELAERLASLRPDMRVLYTSGYTDDAILRYGMLDDTNPLLEKPYSPEALLRRVRAVLASPILARAG